MNTLKMVRLKKNASNNLDIFWSRMYTYARVQLNWFAVTDYQSATSTAVAFEIKGKLSDLNIQAVLA